MEGFDYDYRERPIGGGKMAYARRFFCFLAIVSGLLRAQAPAPVSATDGYTPSMIAPGTPEGSYILSDFDTVNYANGSVNFRFPFVKVTGRGKTSTTLLITGFNTMWRVQAIPVMAYNQQSAYVAGWTYTVFPGSYYNVASYGGGTMFSRTAAYDCYTS